MSKSNLLLVGIDKWGNSVSRRLYRGIGGKLMVARRKAGTLRRTFVPYREYMGAAMEYGYIMEA